MTGEGLVLIDRQSWSAISGRRMWQARGRDDRDRYYRRRKVWRFKRETLANETLESPRNRFPLA